MQTKRHFDYYLLFVVLALLGFGLTSLYSASTVESYKVFNNTSSYILRQVTQGLLLGLLGMLICAKIDYKLWKKYLGILIAISLSLLLAVKLSNYGQTFNGASRWLDIGPVSFQPSELAKLVIIFYLAGWAEKKRNEIKDFTYGVLPSLVIITLFAGLILWQPDFGTMLVILSVSFGMLFVSGINWKYFFWSIIAGIITLATFIHFEPYRARRVTTFLNPSFDPQGIGYHINQALIAIGSGGLWGYGYGLSRQKHSYLPEAMTDSIFAITAEELGFVRALFIIILFCLLALKGYKIAQNAPDTFGRLVAFGITLWITFQALINIAAMVSLVPLTGIPLPFFSYGSTALILNLCGIGILFNISHKSKNV
jgi:cell division protein FtsW